MEYPECWVILKISNNEEVFYKVLAGWYGGYLIGQSWKLNSGIVKVEETEYSWKFYGESGSIYNCTKNSYKLNSITNEIFQALKDKFGEKIELLEKDTNWLELIKE